MALKIREEMNSLHILLLQKRMQKRQQELGTEKPNEENDDGEITLVDVEEDEEKESTESK